MGRAKKGLVAAMLRGREFNPFEAFLKASRHGHLDILKLLVELAERHQVPIENVLPAENCRAFYLAAAHGHRHIVNFLVDLAELHHVRVRQMLEAGAFDIFQEVARGVHPDALLCLIALLTKHRPDAIAAMLQAQAFRRL